MTTLQTTAVETTTTTSHHVAVELLPKSKTGHGYEVSITLSPQIVIYTSREVATQLKEQIEETLWDAMTDEAEDDAAFKARVATITDAMVSESNRQVDEQVRRHEAERGPRDDGSWDHSDAT